jgi:hypothetical protein
MAKFSHGHCAVSMTDEAARMVAAIENRPSVDPSSNIIRRLPKASTAF